MSVPDAVRQLAESKSVAQLATLIEQQATTLQEAVDRHRRARSEEASASNEKQRAEADLKHTSAAMQYKLEGLAI